AYPPSIPPPAASTLSPYTTLFRSHIPPLHTPSAQVYLFRNRLSVSGGLASRKSAADPPDLPQGMDAPRRGPHTVFSARARGTGRSEEHTSELQSRFDLVCRLLLEK